MPVFAYRGLAPNGRTINGVIDADSPRNARGKLRELGIFPTELSAEQPPPKHRLRELAADVRTADSSDGTILADSSAKRAAGCRGAISR